MKKHLLLIMLVFLMGCYATVHGPVKGQYPPSFSSQSPATITIERADTFVGSEVILSVTINGEMVYGLKQKEQIIFKANPGENSFGVKGLDGVGRVKHHEIMINCEAGKTYYIYIQAHNYIPPTIERVDKLEIEK